MSEKKKSWIDRTTPDRALEMGINMRMQAAEGACSRLREIADFSLTKDQAKRSANQVAKLRKELAAIEGEFRKAAGEGEG